MKWVQYVISSSVLTHFRKRQITVEQCDNDADTSIVRAALDAATDGSVEVSKILRSYCNDFITSDLCRHCF